MSCAPGITLWLHAKDFGCLRRSNPLAARYHLRHQNLLYPHRALLHDHLDLLSTFLPGVRLENQDTEPETLVRERDCVYRDQKRADKYVQTPIRLLMTRSNSTRVSQHASNALFSLTTHHLHNKKLSRRPPSIKFFAMDKTLDEVNIFLNLSMPATML